MASIAVTGASGKLGSAVIRFLLERKVAPPDIVAVVRDPAKVADAAARGVQARRGDYTEPASLESAFRGVDQLLFISSSALGEERMLHHRNVVTAARTAGVKHIFYTSAIKASADARFAASPGHFHTEVLIRESGIAYTFFRNNLYLDLVPLMFGAAVPTGTLVHNGGDARVGFVAREDIAFGLAAALTHGDHRNRTYAITALSPYSLTDIAAALGKASGKNVVYKPTSSEDFRKYLESAGLPAPIVGMSVGLGEAIRAGEFDAGAKDLEHLMGRPPVALEPFLGKALTGFT